MKNWVKEIMKRNNPNVEFVDVNGVSFWKENKENINTTNNNTILINVK